MSEPLIDGFGRVHRDLRISVTDRCNFRCTYCMPAEGMNWLPRSEVLTFEEIERIASLLVTRFGIDSIRLTGGEPLLRAHLSVLVGKLAALRTPDGEELDLALTTNGSTLAHSALDLRIAGLGRLNVSLDSLQRERFAEMTRRDELHSVLSGIDAALAAGFAPLKVNCVLERGVNDSEIIDFARFGRDRGVEIRFIEFMPLDAEGAWRRDRVVTQAEIIAAIDNAYPLVRGERGTAPAERFAYADGAGTVAVIASVSEPFCATCDRVRLTAEGGLRNCLFALDEFDLRAPMRSGATDDELAGIIRGCVAAKWAGHGISNVQFVRPSKSMSQIGG